MLLLGLVIHCSQAYLPLATGFRSADQWYFFDESSSSLLAPLCVIIHTYRMPLFFVLAGFFASMLISRRGLNGLISNRVHRVAVPLVASLILLVPLIHAAANLVQSDQSRFGLSVDEAISSGLTSRFSLHHLWFLWHLTIFYALTWLLISFSRRNHSSYIQRIWERLVQLSSRRWASMIFASVSIIFLSQMKTLPGFVDASFTFAPPWYLLGFYGLCYLFGSLLFHNTIQRKRLANVAISRMIVASISIGLYLAAVGLFVFTDQTEWLYWPMVALSSFTIWMFIEAWLGCFQKFLSQPSRIMRYISDASYWVYLIHVPAAIVFQGAVSELEIVAEAKFLLTLFFTTVTSFASYHVLVRGTAIGKLLNGKRYPVWPLSSRSVSADQVSTEGTVG